MTGSGTGHASGSVLVALSALAAGTGIALPPLLRQLVAGDATVYGPDWPMAWRERCLNDPPPLIGCSDFEWLDADGIQTTAAQWLNPAFQNGQRFVPFGASGAGDAWCLVPLEDAAGPGVALVRHDSGVGEVLHRSFPDFVCVQLLEALADLDHWLDEGAFTPEQACRIVRTDVDLVTAGMDAAARTWLQALSQAEPRNREVRDGPRSGPRMVMSLLPQDALEAALGRFPAPQVPAMPIVARWECPPSMERAAARTAAKAPPDWQALAREPGSKLAAVRTHQKAHGSTLLQAKTAVDGFIRGADTPA